MKKESKEEKRKNYYSQKKNEYTQQYIHKNYDQLSIRLPKDGKLTRNNLILVSQSSGLSVNSYIKTAVEEKMDRDGVNIEELIAKSTEESSQDDKSGLTDDVNNRNT